MADTAGVMLLRAGVITQEQLTRAIAARRDRGGTLGSHLVQLGVVTEEQLTDFFRHRLMVPKVSKEALSAITKKVIAVVPSDMAAEFSVVPVSIDREGNLTLAMADPSDTHAVDEVGFFSGHFVMRAVATESAITWALEKYYAIAPRVAGPAAAPAEAAAPAAAPPPAAAPQPAPPAAAPQPAPAAAAPQPAPAAKVIELVADEPSAEPDVYELTERTPPRLVVEPAPAGEQPSLILKRTAEPAEAATPDAGVTLVDLQYTPSGRVAAATTADAADSPAGAALREAINMLRAAQDADTVGCALLIYFASFCERAVFFNVRKSALRMHDCTGKDIAVERLKELSISVEEPSVFRDVMASRLPFRGAPGDGAVQQALATAMPPPAGDAVVVPIAVRHRVVSVIYGDRLTADLTEAGMTRVALEAGIAYERIIAARKEASAKIG